MKTSPIRGAEDKLDLRLEKNIEKLLFQSFLDNNFSEIETPIIEPLDLFKRCVGQNTDVVNKEMFVLDTNDEEKLCLRPEATASVFRAFLNSSVQSGPWKVVSCGPMFRHERPQKGRWRQFDQFNIENIDASNVMHDVALIELLHRVFKYTFELSDFTLHINFLGTESERRAHRVELVKFLETHQDQLCATCKTRSQTNPLRCFDCKETSCQKLLTTAPRLVNFLNETSQQEWQTIQDSLLLLGVNFIINTNLVRGLDYYNGIVFEFVSTNLGAQNTFCGGGRYDLSAPFELKKTYPSIGAAVGTGRLALMLQQTNFAAKIVDAPLHLILPLNSSYQALALMLTRQLTNAGLRADALLESCSLSNMLKKANNLKAKFICILGEDEVQKNCVVLKDMETGDQESVMQSKLVEALLAKHKKQ